MYLSIHSQRIRAQRREARFIRLVLFFGGSAIALFFAAIFGGWI